MDIQAQGATADTAAFTDFVTQASAQARAANPHVLVLTGISTNPTGHQVGSTQLTAAAYATGTVVDRYWLNIPAAGDSCPHCGTPQPQVAIPFLRALSGAR